MSCLLPTICTIKRITLTWATHLGRTSQTACLHGTNIEAYMHFYYNCCFKRFPALTMKSSASFTRHLRSLASIFLISNILSKYLLSTQNFRLCCLFTGLVGGAAAGYMLGRMTGGGFGGYGHGFGGGWGSWSSLSSFGSFGSCGSFGSFWSNLYFYLMLFCYIFLNVAIIKITYIIKNYLYQKKYACICFFMYLV